MLKITEIIEKYNERLVTDFHFHSGEKPYIRKATEIIELSNESEITGDDIRSFIDEKCINEKKNDELEDFGSSDFGFNLNGIGNFRANMYYEQQKLCCAIRVLPLKIPEFSSLGLNDSIKRVLSLKSGLILVTGLTGNGKSTTIASLVNEINKNSRKHIITIEDPIEYRYPKEKCLVSQREVGVDCRSFSEGLRSALRQDPDIIIIGEMRDKETITIALEAAESGHLVFSTLHTSSVAGTMDRIMSYFETEEQSYLRNKLSAVLKGIFCQKLIPTENGNSCRVAMEIMFENSAIKTLIRDGKPYQISGFIQLNKATGMITMEESLVNLVKGGLISKESAKEYANDEKQIELLLSHI